MIKCCKGCEDRYLACHDYCETYKKAVEEDRAKKEWLYIMNRTPRSKIVRRKNG